MALVLGLGFGSAFVAPPSAGAASGESASVTALRGYFAGEIDPGLYPEQLYGRDLVLLSTNSPEQFEMQ